MNKTIIKDYIPINPFSRPHVLLKEVKGIVIHWTANQYTTAHQNLSFFKGLINQKLDDKIKDKYAGTQFIIDWNTILQSMEMNERSYHVGAYNYKDGITSKIGSYPNDYLIGIEVCFKSDSGKFEKETISNLIWLCNKIMAKYNLTINNIYRHHDITGKDCPKYYVENPIEWGKLLNEIKRNQP